MGQMKHALMLLEEILEKNTENRTPAEEAVFSAHERLRTIGDELDAFRKQLNEQGRSYDFNPDTGDRLPSDANDREKLLQLHTATANANDAFWEALRTALSPPHEEDEIINERNLPVKAKSVRKPEPKSIGPVILYPANTLHSATIRSFSSHWEDMQSAGYLAGANVKTHTMEAFFGVHVDAPNAHTVSELLINGDTISIIKAFWGLWGIWYEHHKDNGDPVAVTLSNLCDVMGFAKHKEAHTPQSKRQALKAVDAFSAINVYATSLPQKKGGTKTLLRGKLFDVELVRYENLLSCNGVGAPEHWTPYVVEFKPGRIWETPGYKETSQAVGKLGAGLMRIPNQNKWAICIGSYLGTLLRTNHYKPMRLRVGTILKGANKGNNPEDLRRAKETQAKFEKALDTLVTFGCIEPWKYENVDTTEPDFDDPTSLATYGEDISCLGEKNEWRRKIVVITVERPGDTKRLEAAQKRVAERVKRLSETKKGTRKTPIAHVQNPHSARTKPP